MSLGKGQYWHKTPALELQEAREGVTWNSGLSLGFCSAFLVPYFLCSMQDRTQPRLILHEGIIPNAHLLSPPPPEEGWVRD